MKQAIIDIESNSIRLTIYEVSGTEFRVLERHKVMGSLASYVEEGRLTDEGMSCAAVGLLQFKFMLEGMQVDDVKVFATASLRNISNTDEAEERLGDLTGFEIETISGKEEAYYGYIGAMQEFTLEEGAFVDIGGASTEIVTFADKEIQRSGSYGVGSLRLYQDCVNDIVPGERDIARIQTALAGTIPEATFQTQKNEIICIGGTCRAILKLAKRLCGVPAETHALTREHFLAVGDLFLEEPKEAADLILKVKPDRIHTIVPGYMIMKYVLEKFGAERIVIGRYGVREGYLIKRVIEK